MERINHVNAAISLSGTNLLPPQSFISKLFTFTIKFSCYIWNRGIKNNAFFFLLGKQDLTWASFCLMHKCQWTWHKPHPKTTTTGRITSVMSLVLLKCSRPKLLLGSMLFFHFLRGFSYFSIWKHVNTLTIIPRVYSEFDSMHFRTHWLGRIILTLMNISFTKPSAFASGPD